MKTSLLTLLSVLGISVLGLSSAASAQTTDANSDNDSDGVAYVGALGLLSSEYLGSADEDFQLLPYLGIDNYKGFDLFGPSLSYRAIETGTGQGLGKWSLLAGPNITYEGGRNSDDSPTLSGLDDIDGSFVAGGYVRGTIGPVGIRLSGGQDIAGGHDGISANASVGTLLPLGNLRIQPSASVSWGSAKHNQSFFGITDAQSNATGLDINNVNSGVYGYSANVVSWYEIFDDYVVTVIGSHRWFSGKSNDSPILLAEDGADKGLFLSLGIARRFNL